MKYSKRFEQDYKWYLSVSDIFNFDGCDEYYNKAGKEIIVYDPNGVTAKESFYRYDSEGKIKPTKEPKELKILLKTKGSVNLHIKMYAEDLANFRLTLLELRAWCIFVFKSPDWFRNAIQKQRYKLI